MLFVDECVVPGTLGSSFVYDSVAVLLQALVEYLPMWSVTQHSYVVEWGRFSIVTSLVVGSTAIECLRSDPSGEQVISYSAVVFM